MKCKECKFRCHTLCQSLVPPSCGLPDDLLQHFMHHLTSEGSPILPRSQPTSLVQPPFHSSSSSCNSSTPSSPQVGSSCMQGWNKKTVHKNNQRKIEIIMKETGLENRLEKAFFALNSLLLWVTIFITNSELKKLANKPSKTKTKNKTNQLKPMKQKTHWAFFLKLCLSLW